MADFTTPGTTYEPDDAAVPQGARDSFLSKLGAVALTAFNALDAAVVKLTGAQTIGGVKTFSDSPIVPAGNDPAEAVNFEQLATLDAAVVKKVGTQTITGVKTFSASPIVPAAGDPGDAVNYDQMLTDIASSVNAAKTDIKTGTLGDVKIKKLSFSAWDMSNVENYDVAHGLDLAKIIGVTIVIKTSTVSVPLTLPGSDRLPGGYWIINPTNVSMFRFAAGDFNNPLFGSASGKIVIFYED